MKERQQVRGWEKVANKISVGDLGVGRRGAWQLRVVSTLLCCVVRVHQRKKQMEETTNHCRLMCGRGTETRKTQTRRHTRTRCTRTERCVLNDRQNTPTNNSQKVHTKKNLHLIVVLLFVCFIYEYHNNSFNVPFVVEILHKSLLLCLFFLFSISRFPLERTRSHADADTTDTHP